MLDRKYDPLLSYQFVGYGRMSDEKRQNKRSPDQQFTTIDETLTRCGYPWIRLRSYRDDGISGRYLRMRPGLQQMLRDIEVGLIKPDLIVVDTLERLGRAEEIAELRRKLRVNHGVLVVAADNNFVDPTGVVGKAVGMVEQIRSTENTRISRHNVLRGKKDAARLGHWPGGPAPFGYKLRAIVDDSVSPSKLHNFLEPEPRESAALQLAFERAAATGEGDTRLSQWWNACPEIPEDFKPISPFTMGYRLTNRVCVGELQWGKNRKGVVDDTRVVEPNPDGPIVHKSFCTPIISEALFNRVHELRAARSQVILASRAEACDDEPAKLIAPESRGLALKYMLSGLLRCSCCNSSMRIMPSGRRSKTGTRYIYYNCPRHLDGSCSNGKYVPEDQLREAVVSRLRARLFPLGMSAGQPPEWLPDLLQRVQAELDRYRQYEPGRAELRAQEIKELDDQLAGWRITLSNSKTSAILRDAINADYDKTARRKEELEQERDSDSALLEHVKNTLEPGRVLQALGKLHGVLAAHNPTQINLELSKHIDMIVCHADGRIEMRGTCLGLFSGAAELLGRGQTPPAEPPASADGFAPVKPRRRGRLRLPSLTAESQDALPDVETALDPERFAEVPAQFFWTEEFWVTGKQCWAEQHAAAVARGRAEGKTMAELAEQFGKTVPTIRHALRCACEADGSLAALPKKMPRKRWHEEHAAEVAAQRAEGKSTVELARQFGMSDTTIRAALNHAAKLRQDGAGESAA